MSIMKNQELTSSPVNYSWLILGLIAMICACLLSCCQTKKKSLNLQKSETSQQSEVRKESKDSLTNNSKSTYSKQSHITADYSEVIEESADSTKTDKDGLITVYNPRRTETRTGKRQAEKKTEAKEEKDVKFVAVAKVDSSGRAESKVKSRVQGKDVKDNLTGKALAISLLLICIIGALAYIRWQWKKKKLFMG